MEKPTLNIKVRDITGKKVKGLRREGLLPCIVYGNNFTGNPLSVPVKEFKKLFKEVGGSTVVLLKREDGKTVNVLIHDVQTDVVTREPIHVDFYRVKMDEKITTHIPIHFVGESPAVKDLDGMLITNKDEIEVECLPGDLLSEIEVDVSVLTDFESVIHVSDIKLPDTIKILDEMEEAIVLVEPPRSEEELAELEEPIEAPEMPESEEGAPEEEPAEEENKNE